MSHRDSRAAQRAAVAALPPGACQFLTRVTEIRARKSASEPWELLEIPEGSPAEAQLVLLMMRAVNSSQALELIDLASRREVFRHLGVCPLCAHRAAPGPRVFAVWHGDPVRAAEWEQGWRTADEAALFELPNAAAAQEWAEDLGAQFVERVGGSLDARAELYLFRVPAQGDQLPGFRKEVATAGSELWLWDARPEGTGALRRPDRVLRLEPDGVLSLIDRLRAAEARPRLDFEDTASAFRVESDESGRQLTWFDDGAGGLLVSVRDSQCRQPAVRVTADGQEVLAGAPAGLRLFGRHAGDRPLLAEVERLAPEFVALAPAHTLQHRSRRRS